MMIRTLLLAIFGVAFAKRVTIEKVAEASQATTEGACTVGWLGTICDCDYTSRKLTGTTYKCSGCKDPQNWGYGCDLDCDPSCGPKGCDFSGNCVVKSETLKNSRCKRNSRVSKPTEDTLNERGECQACARDSYGVHCENRCSDISKNCVTTTEGNCTRGGSCYECKEGFYGKTCVKACPSGCKACVMTGGIVPVEGDPKEFLDGGACLDKCKKDTWGSRCDQKCPDNCKKTSTPSCDKSLGHCFKCGTDKSRNPNKPHQWWDDKCETKCADGCVDFQCFKKNGKCENGVKEGYCGIKGDNRCPAGTVGGCDKHTCMPNRCEKGKYPFMHEDRKSGSKAPKCVGCPANCKAGCEQDGTCTNQGDKACIVGFWGAQCEDTCPGGCDGGCDADGKCHRCNAGLTGAKCDKSCHKTCETCAQYNSVLLKTPGNNANNCLSCPDDKPSVFSKATKMCECIEGAEYSEKLGECICSDPGEKNMEPYFVQRPKACLKKCKEGLRAAYAEQKFKCFTGKVYKSVVRAEALDQLKKGKCADGEYEIHVKSSNPQNDEDAQEWDECILIPFVKYILSE